MMSASEKFPKLGFSHMTLWAMMLPHTDSKGRFLANATWIKGQVLPMFDVRLEQVEASLKKLVEVGLIHLYDAGGKGYLVYHHHADFNSTGAMGNLAPKWPDPPAELCVCVVGLKERRSSSGSSATRAVIVSSRLLSSSFVPEPGTVCKLCANSKLTDVTLLHDRHGLQPIKIACPECDVDGFQIALEASRAKGWRVPTPEEAAKK